MCLSLVYFCINSYIREAYFHHVASFKLDEDLAHPLEPEIRVTQFQNALDHTTKRLCDILEGNVDLIQPWKPLAGMADDDVVRHCQNLRVPTIDGRPSLLLHGLGEDTVFALEDSVSRGNRINTVFRPNENTVLFNTSGAGKTRLVLEGLCTQWCFYFTCSKVLSECGSADLQWVIDESPGGYLTRYGITDLNLNPSDEKENRYRGYRCFYAVLCARLLVFKSLLAEYDQGGRNVTLENLRRIWLFVQLDTKLLQRGSEHSDSDIFLELTTLLCYVPNSMDLLSVVMTITNDCKRFLRTLTPTQDPFILFSVIDEAQVAVQAHSTSFCSESGALRPALRAMLQTWQWNGCGLNHIITGTSMNMVDMLGAITSTLSKTKEIQGHCAVNATGAFIESKDQIVRYLNYYLPSSYLKTDSGQDLVARARYWLFGRPRFIAGYIQYLMQNNFRCYHKFLTSYIKDVSKFTPSDAKYWESLEDPKCNPQSPAVMSLDFSRGGAKEKDSDELLDAVERLVNQRLLSGRTDFEKEAETIIDTRLVERGFARYPGGQGMSKFDEPLAYLAADDWIGRLHSRHKFFASRFQYNSPTANGFERYAALCISHIFQQWTPLSQYFEFANINKGKVLSTRRARLVSCWMDSSKTIRVAPVVFPFENTDSVNRSSPSKMLGFASQCPEQDLKWLKFERNAPFLFPQRNFGPDLMFRLQLEGSKQELITVALQTKYLKQSSGLTPSFLTGAFRTVTPHNFWKFKANPTKPQPKVVNRYYCHTRLPKLPVDTIDALKSLPNRFSEDHLVIRGLFVWPAVSKSRDNNDEDTKDILTKLRAHDVTKDVFAKINDKTRKKPIIEESDRIHELFVMSVLPIEDLTEKMKPVLALKRHTSSCFEEDEPNQEEDCWDLDSNPDEDPDPEVPMVVDSDDSDCDAQSIQMDTDNDEASVVHTAPPSSHMGSDLDLDDFLEAQSSEMDLDDSQMPRSPMKRGRSEEQRPNKRVKI
ncbi:hypothetical protein H0H92_003433 [Tricholoma furcatifolium]|nr:hypothetical protein H0H92_003433 [Tricholoma furcatifolium]